LYMAMRFCMDALRASTAFFLPDVSRHHRRDGGGDQAEGAACNSRLRCLSPTDLSGQSKSAEGSIVWRQVEDQSPS